MLSENDFVYGASCKKCGSSYIDCKCKSEKKESNKKKTTKKVKNKITVKTLTNCYDHEEYPEITFRFDDEKPWCESCNRIDEPTPICSMSTNWCLSCIQSMCDTISDEDADKVWKAFEEFKKENDPALKIINYFKSKGIDLKTTDVNFITKTLKNK